MNGYSIIQNYSIKTDLAGLMRYHPLNHNKITLIFFDSFTGNKSQVGLFGTF